MSAELFANGSAIKIEKQRPRIFFTSSMTWNCHLDMNIQNGFQKLHHLGRIIHRTTTETVKCTLVKTYIFTAVFYASNVWNPRPQYLQRLKKLQCSCLKWITCSSILGDKEYVEIFVWNRLLPVSYFLVLDYLILLNRISLRLTSMNASVHWSITFGCAKTRSIEKYPDSIIPCLNLTVLPYLLFTIKKSVSKRSEKLFGRRSSEKIQI